MVRVGSEDAPLAERAREVWVDGLIRRYLDMDAGEWTYRYQARPGMLLVLCHPLESASSSNMQVLIILQHPLLEGGGAQLLLTRCASREE